jgi:YegS/Rv2252/BmrU family lipid kinase
MSSSAIIICNPAARRASPNHVEDARGVLHDGGYRTELLVTERSGQGIELARQALSKNPSIVIAAGGDGTINEVMNGMVRSEVPLAILPMGTTNVLARELDIPEDAAGAMKRALDAEPRAISLGRIIGGGSPSVFDRYFCLMAGIGFDGITVLNTHNSLKKVSGKAAYILSGLRTFLGFDPSRLSLTVDGQEYSGYSAVIGKSSKYGGNFRVTPDARLPEPFLYACIFKGNKRRSLLKYVFGVVTGTHLRYRDVVYLRCSSVAVSGSAHIQIDGDYLGVLPARITVEKDVLRLLY